MKLARSRGWGREYTTPPKPLMVVSNPEWMSSNMCLPVVDKVGSVFTTIVWHTCCPIEEMRPTNRKSGERQQLPLRQIKQSFIGRTFDAEQAGRTAVACPRRRGKGRNIMLVERLSGVQRGERSENDIQCERSLQVQDR